MRSTRIVVQCVLPALLAVATLTAAPSGSTAQTSDADYQRVLREAVREHAAARYQEALALFRRAHELRPSARTLRALGMTSFELRQYTDALGFLESALTDTRQPLTAAQRTEVETLATRSRTFVGRYRVTRAPAEAVLEADHSPVSGDSLVLAAGDHELTATAPGHTTWTRRLTVRGGEDEALAVTLEQAPEATPRPVRTTPRRRTPTRSPEDDRAPSGGGVTRTLGWVGIGVGGALVASGVVAHLLREGAVNGYNDDVRAGRCPPVDPSSGNVPANASADCRDTGGRWSTFGALMAVGYIGGAVIAGTGVVLVITAPSSDRDEDAQSARVECSPAIGGTEAVVQCAGRF